jgi:hypothetical protein
VFYSLFERQLFLNELVDWVFQTFAQSMVAVCTTVILFVLEVGKVLNYPVAFMALLRFEPCKVL